MVIRIAKVTLALLFLGLRAVCFTLLRLTGKSLPPTFVVLMYHSVKRDERARFARQMKQLKKAGEIVPADLAVSEMRPGHHYRAVTFDDGFSSFIENVLPILRQVAVPATVFVPTKYLGRRPGWLSDALVRDGDERVMSGDELRQVVQQGVDIGSHTVNHRSLADLRDVEIRVELENSKQALTALLGHEVEMLALPFGSSSSTVLRLSQQAGYRRVFLNVPLPSFKNVRHQVAGRIDADPFDWRLEFALKIRGAYQWLPLAIAAKAYIMKLRRSILIIFSSRIHETS